MPMFVRPDGAGAGEKERIEADVAGGHRPHADIMLAYVTRAKAILAATTSATIQSGAWPTPARSRAQTQRWRDHWGTKDRAMA